METSILFLLLFTCLSATAAFAQAERIERGQLVIEGIPEIPKDLLERLRQYQSTRSASLVDWLPQDEGILIMTRLGETDQIHQVSQPGGARQQMTFFNEPVQSEAVSPSPNLSGFLFGRDTGGGEFYQLFLFDRSYIQ